MNQFRPRNPKKVVSKLRFTWLQSAADWLTINLGLEQRLTASVLSKVLWIGFLTMIYIYFQHSFDKLIRKTDKAANAVEEKRALYINHKAKYLYASKQSEIEKKLEGRGFTNKKSPIKISVINP